MHMQNLVKFYQFVLKILSRNEFLISIKGRNSVLNLWKLTCNNPKLDLANINALNLKYGQIPSIHSKNIKRKLNSDKNHGSSIKGHNPVTISWKLMRNNRNLDLVNINGYEKFGQILSVCLNISSGNKVGITKSHCCWSQCIWFFFWQTRAYNPLMWLL